jgi:histidinol-phosphate aminotransferase
MSEGPIHPNAAGASTPQSAPFPRQRNVIADLPVYRAGMQAAPGGHKLSSNENPYGPLPSVIEAVSQAATQMNRYPDPGSTALLAALSNRLAFPVDWLAVACGSVALVGQAVSLVAEAGDEVVYSWPSFESYPIVTGIAGATSVRVPLDENFRQDLDAVAEAVSASTRIVFVCTPNNPTGTTVSHEAVERLLARVPSDVLVVIDEAYAEFVDDPLAVDSMSLVREHSNVVVLRTFSKAYGLAGLRVGYAVAHPPVIEGLRKVGLPFGVSIIAQQAAIASLAAESELLERVAQLRHERSRVAEALVAAGWEIYEPQANFIWLGTGPKTRSVGDMLRNSGITAREFPDVGIRISIADSVANDALISALTNL